MDNNHNEPHNFHHHFDLVHIHKYHTYLQHHANQNQHGDKQHLLHIHKYHTYLQHHANQNEHGDKYHLVHIHKYHTYLQHHANQNRHGDNLYKHIIHIHNYHAYLQHHANQNQHGDNLYKHIIHIHKYHTYLQHHANQDQHGDKQHLLHIHKYHTYLQHHANQNEHGDKYHLVHIHNYHAYLQHHADRNQHGDKFHKHLVHINKYHTYLQHHADRNQHGDKFHKLLVYINKFYPDQFHQQNIQQYLYHSHHFQLNIEHKDNLHFNKQFCYTNHHHIDQQHNHCHYHNNHYAWGFDCFLHPLSSIWTCDCNPCHPFATLHLEALQDSLRRGSSAASGCAGCAGCASCTSCTSCTGCAGCASDISKMAGSGIVSTTSLTSGIRFVSSSTFYSFRTQHATLSAWLAFPWWSWDLKVFQGQWCSHQHSAWPACCQSCSTNRASISNQRPTKWRAKATKSLWGANKAGLYLLPETTSFAYTEPDNILPENAAHNIQGQCYYGWETACKVWVPSWTTCQQPIYCATGLNSGAWSCSRQKQKTKQMQPTKFSSDRRRRCFYDTDALGICHIHQMQPTKFSSHRRRRCFHDTDAFGICHILQIVHIHHLDDRNAPNIAESKETTVGRISRVQLTETKDSKCCSNSTDFANTCRKTSDLQCHTQKETFWSQHKIFQAQDTGKHQRTSVLYAKSQDARSWIWWLNVRILPHAGVSWIPYTWIWWIYS